MVGTRGNPTGSFKSPAKKSRNRATPLKAIKSPDISFPEKGADDQSSVSTTSSKRPGLDRFVQKEVAELLEGKGGGIANYKVGSEHALAALLDLDEDTFGKRGVPIRRQISKYVTRWVGYHKDGTYADKVLNRFSIPSHATRKKQAADSKKSGLSIEDISDGSSLGSGSSDSVKQSVSRKPNKSKTAKKSVKSKTRKSKPPTEVTVQKKAVLEPKYEAKASIPVSPVPSTVIYQAKANQKQKMADSGELSVPLSSYFTLNTDSCFSSFCACTRSRRKSAHIHRSEVSGKSGRGCIRGQVLES